MTSTVYVVRPQPTVRTTDRPIHVEAKSIQTGPYAGLIAALPDVVEVDHSEGAKILDRAARRKLGISGEEFIRRWDAGDFEGESEDVNAEEVAMLLPFARPVAVDAR